LLPVALLWLSWVARDGRGWAWAVFALVSVPLALIDAHRRILPSRLVWLGVAAILVKTAADVIWFAFDPSAPVGTTASDWRVDPPTALNGVLGGLLAGGVFWLVWRLGKRRAGDGPTPLGFGDVRLAVLIGIPTGMLGLFQTALALMIGAACGAIYGLLPLSRPKSQDASGSRQDGYPFGPFLIAGAFAVLALGRTGTVP
jgi:leader peptidase (prepilin peptidase)/N-methyltransferase